MPEHAWHSDRRACRNSSARLASASACRAPCSADASAAANSSWSTRRQRAAAVSDEASSSCTRRSSQSLAAASWLSSADSSRSCSATSAAAASAARAPVSQSWRPGCGKLTAEEASSRRINSCCCTELSRRVASWAAHRSSRASKHVAWRATCPSQLANCAATIRHCSRDSSAARRACSSQRATRASTARRPASRCSSAARRAFLELEHWHASPTAAIRNSMPACQSQVLPAVNRVDASSLDRPQSTTASTAAGAEAEAASEGAGSDTSACVCSPSSLWTPSLVALAALTTFTAAPATASAARGCKTWLCNKLRCWVAGTS
mmetsp:Transcript_52345/g.148203  ORF Transcript_52345/g.148203 Transcript_52345/m.148203 type:complete len:321 (+) Transcript_52345:562-1524(+)